MMETDQINRSNDSARPLVRPREGRVLAGVAVALAHRLSIPTWLVRVVFVFLGLSGGVGFLAYAAGWLLIPAEGQAQPAAGQLLGRIEGPRAWIGAGLVVLAVFVAVESTGVIDADLAVAAALILVGVLLYRGDLGSVGSNEEDSQTMTTETSQGVTSTTEIETQAGDRPAEPPALPPEPPVPSAATPPPIAPTPRPRSILGRVTIAAGLIVLGVMGFIDTVTSAELNSRHYFGTAVAIVGLGLLLGSFVGRARGLIVLGVVLIPPLLLSPLGDLDFRADNVRYQPQTVSDIQPVYVSDVGDMMIDLGDVDFQGQDVAMEAEIRFGQITIIVPDDVAVDATALVAIGRVEVFESEQGGFGEITTRRQEPGENGSLTIDARADAGQIQIERAGDTFLGLPGRGGLDGGPQIDGDSDVAPTTGRQLRDSYEIGVGDLELDLSELELDEAREVTAAVDLGTLTVILPDGIDAEVFASVDMGDIDLPSGNRSGVNRTATYSTGSDPLLTLDLEVGAGTIIVEDMR